VRISPFDSNKRRHTSFAAVAVIPNLGDASSRVQINESDLRIERFRSSGAGGQHANTTESAVKITHIPTGVTATCQNERYIIRSMCTNSCIGSNVLNFEFGYYSENRSQHQNKASAMAVLQSRLNQLEMARQAQLNAQHTQSFTDITWGSQIRSYVLHVGLRLYTSPLFLVDFNDPSITLTILSMVQPYQMVKDLRTNYEVSDPDSVLQGDLEGFIMSYLSASLDKNEDDP
jgi:peptide chain release factor 2